MTLVGPKGLNRVVSALRVIAPELPFEIKTIELTGQQEHLSVKGYEIDAIPCKPRSYLLWILN